MDFFCFNRDEKRRLEIVGVDSPDFEFGGCHRMCASYEKVNLLFKEHFIDPTDQQNASPTAKRFLLWASKWLQKYNLKISFLIYLISPDRDDYRVSIEGMIVESEETIDEKSNSLFASSAKMPMKSMFMITA